MDDIYIPPDSQKRLLQLSRETLEGFVLRWERQDCRIDDPYLLTSRYGAFVSLHKGEELRGCIGTCFPTNPLYETVVEMTRAAASRDHRVPPIIASELPAIHIEISVLSPPDLVNDPRSVEVGRHGLHIQSRERRGVLLPQVATQYGWDLETFLAQACLKVGLPKNAWKWPETRISRFTALILGEQR